MRAHVVAGGPGPIAILAASLLVVSPAQAATTCAATGLRELTQTFSDAGQRHDGPAMGRLLDDRVIFINEGGEIADKAALSAPGTAPPSGTVPKITVRDWECQLHGDVAVTTFVDDLTLEGPSPAHARFRSVETWLKAAGAWRMIGSETIALPDDPVAVELPALVLDEYAGTYRGPSGQTFSFRRDENRLIASLDGGPQTPQLAEVRDVFFTPGRPRYRKVFQRDASGRIVAFAYRREGHDTQFARIAS